MRNLCAAAFAVAFAASGANAQNPNPGPLAESPATSDKQHESPNKTTDSIIADARSAASSFSAALHNFLAERVTTPSLAL